MGQRMSHDALHEYLINHPDGDIRLQTDSHHTMFDSIEDFLHHHHDVISEALGVATLAVSTVGVVLAGKRLR